MFHLGKRGRIERRHHLYIKDDLYPSSQLIMAPNWSCFLQLLFSRKISITFLKEFIFSPPSSIWNKWYISENKNDLINKIKSSLVPPLKTALSPLVCFLWHHRHMAHIRFLSSLTTFSFIYINFVLESLFFKSWVLHY